MLLNENRPSLWDLVCNYLDKHGLIGNTEVRRIMGTDSTLAASKVLKDWVSRGLLEVANPEVGKRARKYKLPEVEPARQLFSNEPGKQDSSSQ